MIVVTGANGRLGRRIAERLTDRLGPDALAVSVRDPGRAEPLARRGVAVRRGDFDDPELTARAFEGASIVMMVSTHDANDVRLRQHKTAVDAAVAAGAGRLVYTSFPRPEPANPFSFAALHRATEAYIAASGMARTFLRNGSYAESLAPSIRALRETGRLEWPSDQGAVAYTAVDDLADAAAAVLADAAAGDGADAHVGATYTLTGPEAIGADDLARRLGARIGRAVELVVIPEAEYAQKLRDAGAPGYAVESAVTAFRSIARGYLADVTGDVERLTGHPPTTLEAALAAMDV
jgi:NAD(P)H dehydrogenase (quinone)